MEERAWLVDAKPHLGTSCVPHGLPSDPFQVPPLLTMCPLLAYWSLPSGAVTQCLDPPSPVSSQNFSHPDLNSAVLKRVKTVFQKGDFKLDLTPTAFSKLRREGIGT